MTNKEKKELILHLNRQLQNKVYPKWQGFVSKKASKANDAVKHSLIESYTKANDADINQQYLPIFLESHYPFADVLFQLEKMAFQSAKRIVADLLWEVQEYGKK
jgi:hypothetical protein